MQAVLASVISLFVSLLFVNAGNAYLLTLIGVQLGINETPPMDVGLMMSSYAVGFVAGTIFAPKLLMKVGHIRTFAALASMTGMAAISYPFSNELMFWCILRALGGFFVAGLFVVIESWFSAISSVSNRSTIFSIYLVATYSASAAGQLSIGFGISQGVYIAFTMAGILIFSSIVPLSISSRQSPSVDDASSMNPIRLAKRAALGLVGAVCGGILLSSFYGLVPLYGSMSDMTPETIGQLMSTSVILAMLMAWPIGWLTDRIPRSSVLLGVLLIAAASAAMIFLLGKYMSILIFVGVPIIMACSSTIYSISVAITQDLVDNDERIGASSTLLMGYGVGSIVGPLGGSWLMDVLSPDALFLGFVGILVFLILFTSYRQFKQAPIPVELQEQFVPTMPEAQVNAELDPRSPDNEEPVESDNQATV